MMEENPRMQQYLLLAKSARGRSAAELVLKAIAEPLLFTFGELLDHPTIRELDGGEFAPYADLLRLFAYGTWQDHKDTADASKFPPLAPQHKLKLKQLTVATMATQSKVIPYTELKQRLDISEVRDLEDFLITECFYSGIIKGSLDQKAGCLYIKSFAARDVPPAQLKHIIDSLQQWSRTSDTLLGTIEERMQQAAAATELVKQHKESLESKVEDIKKALQKTSEMEARAADSMALDDAYDMMDEERSIARPKRRR